MAKGAKEPQSFESSVSRLEEIVEQMESADMPLEHVIDHYEEGIKLLATCEEKLKAAEVKIELLTRNKSGNISRSDLADMDKTASVEVVKEEEKSDSDEARLF